MIGPKTTPAQFFPGYNHLTHLVSELGAEGAPAVSVALQTIVGAGLTGIFILLFALGCYLGIRMPIWSKSTFALLLGIVGITFMLQCVYRCDPGCSSASSTSDSIHGILGTAQGFALILALAPAVAIHTFRRDSSWKPFFWIYSLGTSVAFLLIFFVFANLSGAWIGLLQRFGTLVFFLWVEMVAVRLFRLERSLA